MAREIARHRVDVVGEVLPHTAHVFHFGLTAELAFRTDFARDARHFRREPVQLIDHRIDGLLELENFAFDIDRDLAGQVAAGDGGRHFRDVAHLARQVRRHRVHVIREILPRACDAGHDRLPAELAFGADFARDARHLGRERAQLIDHGVDGFFELLNFAADVDGDLAREIAVRDRGRDVGDVAHLTGQIAGHRVHVIGEILPRTGCTRDDRLSAELAFGADLARDARHFRGKQAHLIDHGVHDRGGALELALERAPVDFHLHALRQIAFRNGADRARDFGGRPQEIVDQRVDRAFHRTPRAGAPIDRYAVTRFAFLADHLPRPLDLLRHALARGDDLVERVGHFARNACLVARQPHREIAVAHSLQRSQELAQVQVGIVTVRLTIEIPRSATSNAFLGFHLILRIAGQEIALATASACEPRKLRALER